MRLSIKEIQVKEGRRSLDTCHVGELAEIDENIVRSDMSTLEYGEILLRRKEIYETLHPETKREMRNGQTSKNDKMSFLETKSFAQDTAEKLGVVPRTVERQIQTAKNLTQEAKEIIKNADKKISKKEALKLSRLEPEDQKEAARLLTTQQIRNMGEYAEKKKEEPEKAGDSLKDMIAELKDPDKDCSGTPDSFLEEYGLLSGNSIKRSAGTVTLIMTRYFRMSARGIYLSSGN